MLDPELSAALQAGRAAWVGVKLDDVSFVRLVGDLAVSRGDLAERGPDLFLAWACAAKDPSALGYFERTFLPEVDSYVARLGLSPGVVDDVRQDLRIRLLVGPAPRIGQYGGRGPLGAWVRMAAIRIALNLLERERRRQPTSDVTALSTLIGEEANPEIAAVRSLHGGAFQQALDKSLRVLDARDKTLLRMHFVDQLDIDTIGQIYRVHRATVARWLVAIRRRVLDNLRAELSLELPATTSEFRSMLTVLRADLEVSVRHLAPTAQMGERRR
jgi:RNA polymerase sigma-70 factor, ECF subfamily